MTGCAIVAIPDEYSPVWKVSSEKIPHITLLYLGDLPNDTDHEQLSLFVQHAATNLQPIGLSVASRGTLGDENADVLFFEKQRDSIRKLVDFRSNLLSDTQISKAYNSAFQYPEWTPHLTLGYPSSPAKPVPTDRNTLDWIFFDRIAVWFGDFEGPTFKLEHKENYYDGPEGLAMSDSVDDVLAHFGVKGMRWGVRKAPGEDSELGQTRSSRGVERRAAKAEKIVAKADKKWEKKNSTQRKYLEVYNDAAGKMNRVEIARINNKPEYKGQDFRKDSPLRQQYYKEYETVYNKALNDSSAQIMGTNASGTKKVEWDASGGMFPTARIVDVDARHADDEDLVQITWTKTGHFASFKMVAPIAHADEVVDVLDQYDVLQHFGVKGMKWGVRKDAPSINTNVETVNLKAPRKDPKFTDLKAKKYQAQNADTAVTVVQRPGQKLATKGGSNREAHPDAVKAAEDRRIAKSSTTDALSTKDLQQLVSRMNLEQQYNKLANPAPRDPMAVEFIKGLVGIGQNIAKQQVTAVGNEQVKQAFMKNGLLSNPNASNDSEPRPRREYDEQENQARRAASRRY